MEAKGKVIVDFIIAIVFLPRIKISFIVLTSEAI